MKTKSKPKKVKLMSLVSVSGRWVAPWEGDDGSTVIARGELRRRMSERKLEPEGTAGSSRSLWDNPQSSWSAQLPAKQDFRDPKVTDAVLRAAVETADDQSREFASPVTAEALTHTFAAGGVHGVVVDDAAGTIAVLGTTGRFERVGT